MQKALGYPIHNIYSREEQETLLSLATIRTDEGNTSRSRPLTRHETKRNARYYRTILLPVL